MNLLNNLLDHFNKAEFEVASNKKLKSISAEFAKNFKLSLFSYKGNMLADSDMTLAALNKKTTKTVNAKAGELIINGSMKVGEVEKLFDSHFGVTVQIKDEVGKVLVPHEITLGQASRKEY